MNHEPRFIWQKKGRLAAPPVLASFSHAACPCVWPLGGDTFLLAFSPRDPQQHSHIFLAKATMADGRIELDRASLIPALPPGEPGCFDEGGAISGCFASVGSTLYLYYVGWQSLPSVTQANTIGRAICDPAHMTLRREFNGPVLGRDPVNPLFTTAPFILNQAEEEIHIYYGSGIYWRREGDTWTTSYNIRRARSRDGVSWKHEMDFVMPFLSASEYVVARPSIIIYDDIYNMWYCRIDRTLDNNAYRIGHCWSKDGVNWRRVWDGKNTIQVSSDGWDSQMVTHPFVFRHKEWLYMLYDGNGFGRDGFGYAVAAL